MIRIKEDTDFINVRCAYGFLSLFLHFQLQTAVLVGPGVVYRGTLSDCLLCLVGDAVVVSRRPVG